ncbi:MAG: hypothetical protein EXS10_08080 [Phycisphaerales bacterium]|nr:hypothetical protein [Phycisphaerales bacterium]
MIELSAWLLPIAAILGLSVIVALAVRALGGDRAKGRRRCPKCWHTFVPKLAETVVELRCVECGFLAQSEVELARPRRHWLLCGMWIVCAAALALAMYTHFAGTNFWTLAPTRVLLWSIDFSTPSTQSHPARDELVRRIMHSGWSDASQQSLMQSMLARHEGLDAEEARVWKLQWERPLRAWLATVDASDATRDALLQVPIEVAVDAPLRLLARAPMQLVFRVDEFWPESIEGRLELLSPLGETQSVLFDPAGYRGARTAFEFAPLGWDAHEGEPLADVQFIVRSSWRTKSTDSKPAGAWIPLAEQSMSIPLHQAVARETLLTPYDNASLREAVSSAFRDGLVRWTGVPSRAGLRFDVGATASTDFRDILIGVRATIRHNAHIVRVSRLWWSAHEGSTVGWSMSLEHAAELARAIEGQPQGWTLTLEGDAEIASFLLAETMRDATLPPTLPIPYFSGVVELPLTITDYTTPAPPRRFAPEFLTSPSNL